MNIKLPDHISYVCIEGVIGVGKTSLCHCIAKQCQATLLLEPALKNPFLADFYRKGSAYAFQTQLWFLSARYEQMRDLSTVKNTDQSVIIADYLFSKDNLFARMNLTSHEYLLYSKFAQFVESAIEKPDFVIYLQASTDTLMQRINLRARPNEHTITRSYIEKLNQAYNTFFFHYKDSPLLIMNTDEIDFVKNPDLLPDIIEHIKMTRWGSTYYNPMSRKERMIIDTKREASV